MCLECYDECIVFVADVELWKPPELFHYTGVSGFTVHGMMYTPADLNVNKKYPVVLYVYAGPHVQLATNSYKAMRYIFWLYCSFILFCKLPAISYIISCFVSLCVICDRFVLQGVPKFFRLAF